jgi:membrane peptidoglycan carboxypeptidase
MYDLGKITKVQLNDALGFPIAFQPQSVGNIKAPHFVMAVQSYLVQKYGEDMVDHGGLRVMTTLDWNLQQAAETAVASGVARNQQLYQAFNGALIAQDPKTGQVLAMVGSRNYFATSSLPLGCTPSVNCKFDPNFNVAMQGLRQPGSSLKPFIYMTAFQKGYTPDSILFDIPTEFSTVSTCPSVPNFKAATDTKCYHPQNFEGVFNGPMSIRDSLAQSENVPAVEMLYLVGEKDAIKNAYSFGFTTLTDPDLYGLSLVLGGGAVRLYDEVEAYSVLANEGIKHDQSMILQVRDSDGNVLESYQDKPTQVGDAQSIRLVTSILSDSSARAPLFQSSLNLTVFPGYDVALKTGTSNDFHDAWAMGYTPSLVVGVWAGNNDNVAMKKNGSSILAAVPMWSAFMKKALPMMPNETFNKPDPVNPTNPVLAGFYPAENPPHSILYYVDRNNPTGPAPVNPASDSQFKNWEAAMQAWTATHPLVPAIPSGSSTLPASPPLIQQ